MPYTYIPQYFRCRPRSALASLCLVCFLVIDESLIHFYGPRRLAMHPFHLSYPRVLFVCQLIFQAEHLVVRLRRGREIDTSRVALNGMLDPLTDVKLIIPLVTSR